LLAQQVADTTYHPPIFKPEYGFGKGPVVFIDDGHYNFHTKEGRYKTFAMLLERDGYQVKSYRGQFDKKKLSEGKILVISNALNQINEHNWYLPTPSAFTKEEIESVKTWVKSGGSLFLIADHMPLAGAAQELADSFGFKFTNGFVMDTVSNGPAIFNLENKTLIESVITKGRNESEQVNKIVTFTGQGFTIPGDATPILVFGGSYVNLMPDTAWVFTKDTPSENAKGLLQGAYKKFGKGRIVMSGEAAMFSAQLAGPNRIKVGMNSELADENYKLLLNIIHWLDGKLN
jgi:uncharacterized protein (DUF2249 family)